MDSKELWKQNYRKTILSVLILIIKTEKIQTVKSNDVQISMINPKTCI